MPDGVLNLNVVDVYGETLREPIDIFFRHMTLSERLEVRGQRPARTIRILGLRQSPQGRYSIDVATPSYAPVSRFINIPSGEPGNLSLKLPVNSHQVVSVDFPDFAALTDDARRILGASTIGGRSGQQLYNDFDSLRKAGFLNLVTKAEHTRLPGSKTVLSYLSSILEQDGDRLFALAGDGLHAAVERSAGDLFHKAADLLHHPRQGFHPVDSYKTPEHFGNLQLTFSQDAQRQWSVDMDIDDAQGFDHFFQVARNWVTRQPTHPYNIHEILVAYQELDPGYRFKLTAGRAAEATA